MAKAALASLCLLAAASASVDEQCLLQTQAGQRGEDVRTRLARKQGMNANGAVPKSVLERFTGTSSWFWTYGLAPSPKALEWAQEHGKEFVPLVSLKRVLPKGYGSCSFKEGTCKVDDIVEVLNDTKSKVTTRYLMGYNEPYASHQQASGHGNKHLKGVDGTEGARWWRLWVQPAAQKAGLELVSPTTGISQQKSSWLIEFLQACFDSRNEDPPCNVELVRTYSIHEYKCYGSFWRKYAARDGGGDVDVVDGDCPGRFKPRNEVNFYTQLKTAMRARYGNETADSFWDPYFDSVKLWVTETSCSGDLDWDKVNKDNDDLPETPTAEDSCRYITGQDCFRQEGSVQALLGMDNIERFSWFTLFPNPPRKHPNYESITAAAIMDHETLEPRPVGRALLNGLEAHEAECDGA